MGARSPLRDWMMIPVLTQLQPVLSLIPRDRRGEADGYWLLSGTGIWSHSATGGLHRGRHWFAGKYDIYMMDADGGNARNITLTTSRRLPLPRSHVLPKTIRTSNFPGAVVLARHALTVLL